MLSPGMVGLHTPFTGRASWVYHWKRSSVVFQSDWQTSCLTSNNRDLLTAYWNQGDYACFISIIRICCQALMQSKSQQGWELYLEYTATW